MLRLCKRSIHVRSHQRLKHLERHQRGIPSNRHGNLGFASTRTVPSVSSQDFVSDEDRPLVLGGGHNNLARSSFQLVGAEFMSPPLWNTTFEQQRLQGTVPPLLSLSGGSFFKGRSRNGISSALLSRNQLGRFHAGPTHPWRSVAWMSTGPSLKTNKVDEPEESLTTKTQVPPASSPPRRSPSSTRTVSYRPRKLGKTPVPTPATGPEDPMDQLSGASTKSILRKGSDMVLSVFQMLLSFTIRLPSNIWYFITHPTAASDRVQSMWDAIKHEAHHYFVGTKLLWEEMKTARKLLFKTLDGTALTRRERKQLLRTVSDLFRLIPFSMFILIPFMEFALPFALRIFPNMLPSTYQDSLKAEETMKRELQSRIAMTEFFQETLEQLAKKQKKKASKRERELKDAGDDGGQDFTAHRDSAASMLEFLAKARNGEMIPSDVIYRYANYFQDDLTLDNMPRMQLINMCRYMGIQPYGSESFLRFQLRHKIRTIKEDDGRILWEGIESLNKMELREACQERGMRSTGLSKEAYRTALKEWLDLSVNKDVPIALLIMSRTFFLREDVFHQPQADDSNTMSGLADAISGLDKEIVNEAILEVATHDEKKSDPEVRKIKLEVLSQQNELIREEEEAREAAAKKQREEEEAAKKDNIELSKEAAAVDPVIEGVEGNGSIAAPADTVTMHLNDASVSTIELKPQQEAPTTAVAATESLQPTETTISASGEIKKKELTTSSEEVEDKPEEAGTLSPEEMDAISQLVTDDPVLKERADLERIKAAMQEEAEEQARLSEEEEQTALSSDAAISVSDTQQQAPGLIQPTAAPDVTNADEDKHAEKVIRDMDQKVANEADAATIVTVDDHLAKDETGTGEPTDDEAEDPIVARLKMRVKSMVDKIEVQLTETQIKIGDKLHFLDKDKDGIFTSEEMADAIQTVLRREISFDEALEIAKTMDVNEDGLIRVDELIRWIDEHKLVEFVKEGRDAEMDRIMENHVSQTKQEEPATTPKPQ